MITSNYPLRGISKYGLWHKTETPSAGLVSGDMKLSV